MPKRYAIIPTRADDQYKLLDLTKSLREIGVTPVTIQPPKAPRISFYGCMHLVERERNFSVWLNQGMNEVQRLGGDSAIAAVVNDDLDLDSDGFEAFFQSIDGSDLAFMSGRGDTLVPSPLTPHLFALRPGAGLRMDENMVWWWNTDDFYHRAVEAGYDIAVVPELPYDHTSQNNPNGWWQYPRAFRPWIRSDHDYFYERWGHLTPDHGGCYYTWWPEAGKLDDWVHDPKDYAVKA